MMRYIVRYKKSAMASVLQPGAVSGNHHLNPCCRARLSKVKVAPVGRLKPMSLFVVEYKGFSSFAACLKVDSSASRAPSSSGARRFYCKAQKTKAKDGKLRR